MKQQKTNFFDFLTTLAVLLFNPFSLSVIAMVIILIIMIKYT